MTHQPQSLLVTGGAGFIGANFVHYWMQRYPAQRVTVLDALTYAGNIENLASLREQPHFRFVHGNIRDFDTIAQALCDDAVDTIVHFAAESHVDRSIHGPDAFIDANVLGTHTLLKAAKAVWLDRKNRAAHRFHHVSTDEVYGTLGPEDPPFAETTPYAPNSPYAASKAASDHLVRAYHHTYGLNTTTSNCSNNYGPYQFPEKLIPLLIVNMLAGKPLPVYGDGRQVRDWLEALQVRRHDLSLPALAVTLALGASIAADQLGSSLAASSAAAASPDNHEISYHLAAVLARNGKRDEAVRLLQQLGAADSDFPSRSEAERLLQELTE